MKRIMLSTKIACGAFILAAATFASCSDSIVGGAEDATDGATDATTGLTTVKLATFAGDQSRVVYAGTRGTEGDETEKSEYSDVLKQSSLELVATIVNPLPGVFSEYVSEDEPAATDDAATTEDAAPIRYLSATAVYYAEPGAISAAVEDIDATKGTYIVTYHMQGNNYNTTVNKDIAGAVQLFQLDGDEVKLNKLYYSGNRDEVDYDLNHIYFDKVDKRIVVVGHDWTKPNKWDGVSYENTHAIIGQLDLENKKLDYKKITTADKLRDDDGKSLGDEDAGDANCVIRINNYNNYYVTTRKGLAVLHADEENLFEPQLGKDGEKYFVPTPGSAKFVYNNAEASALMHILYLDKNKYDDSEEVAEDADLTYEMSSKAHIAQLQVETNYGVDNGKSFLALINPDDWKNDRYESAGDLNIEEYKKQIELTEQVSPIDGKNAFCVINTEEYYAPLGTNGLYYKFKDNSHNAHEGVVTFEGTSNNLPVNCVYAEECRGENGHHGFIYVACGARLYILYRETFEVVAYYNIPTRDADGKLTTDVKASANYIHVEQLPMAEGAETRERVITVAYGQAGVKVFKFDPAVLGFKIYPESITVPNKIKVKG